MPGKARKGKSSHNNDPNQTSLKGWVIPKPSSAASQPSSSNLTHQPAQKNPKRVATSSLEVQDFTTKRSKSRGDEASINPPTHKTAPRHPTTSTQDDLHSNSNSDDISSDEDEDDCGSDDDGRSDELDDGFARCIEAEKMPSTSLPVTGDDFWMSYLITPLEQHASRLGLKPTPLPETTYKRLSEVLDFVLANKSVYFVWTINSMSKNVRKRLLGLLGLFMPTNFQELLAGPNPPSATQIYSLIDANGVWFNEYGVRVDKLEGRSEVQSRSVGAYWKVALPKGSVHHHPPLRILIYTGQTAKVSPSDNTMGFRLRWRQHVNDAYGHDEANKKDSLFTKAFIKSREEYRMAFTPIVTVPVPVGTKLDIPFRNAVKFFARLSEAVCHEACSTIYRVDPGCAHTPKTFWENSPREYTGMNARDPLRESFGFWELGKPQRPSPNCSTCGKLFGTKTQRDQHEVEVHGPNTFVCKHDGCVYRCSSEKRLETHRKSVHGKKEFACKIEGCERKYGTKKLLNMHRKEVHGEKVHACDECEREYGTEGRLNMHRKEVHGEKVHACDECEKKFRTNSLLNAHNKKVHQEKTVSCKEIGCRTMFRYESQARTHMKRCHPERKFVV
ncbi:hypothetical protein L198_02391 [Cryptococcus wingfieldii CBS 7118]|uniref:C2H2-type domain-containing protein n=1 Tax=Cryptococcus wingfieldii CBS 7118 TaxID=1295528 RepID=A0A1E3JRT1_9TREE|nr:hypothetical protein L198_02391 [Cryptococcus wingfieldii CBS 7118]ODO03543.1 hypothetical protein L198_02391 [Cryptococcus wingfieldii CBS 7118]